MKIIFYLFLFFCYKYQYCNIITFPFQRILSPNIDESNFYSHYAHNVIYTNLKIGTPITEIKAQIKTSQFSLCIRNDSIYDYNTSSTYFQNSEEFNPYNKDYTNAISSNETFIFGKESAKAENIKFLLTKKSKFDLDGILGLKIYENNNKVYGHGLISQLKSKKIINNETFFFDFDKNNINIGELVIGEYPHLIDKYKENYPYYQFKSAGLHIQTYDIKFEIKVISSYWYGKKFENDVKIEIDIESGYIIGSKYFEEAADKFFTPYFRNKKCRRDTVNVLYYAYICDDDIDISSFPEIKFYTGDADYNFTLTYEDVFVKKFGKTYFMIVFDTKGYNVFWTLGSTFIKRNSLVFDMNRRIVGFYDKNIKDKNNYTIYIIIISLAGIIIIALVAFIIYKFVWKKRPKFANELEDDFVYSPNEPKLGI